VKEPIPEALEAIWVRAMALRPDGRYPTALALAADVERWMATGESAPAMQPYPFALRAWRSVLVKGWKVFAAILVITP
jgi:hypothetical protein